MTSDEGLLPLPLPSVGEQAVGDTSTPVPAEDPGDPDRPPGLVATYRSVWQHRRWRWLAGSTVVSLFGDFLYWVAITVFLLSGPSPAAWLAASLLARLVPYVLLGPIGGAIADRVDRRFLLVTLATARGALFIVIAAVTAVDGPRLAVIGVLVLNAACGAFFEPARGAVIPQIVPESDLPAANAAEQGLAQISWFVGPAVGAALVAVTDVSVVLVVNAATFFLQALLLSRLGRLVPTVDARTDDDDDQPASLFATMVADVRSGFGIALRERGVRGLVILNAIATMAFGAEQVLYVLVAADQLDLGPEGVGYLFAAMGVGGIIAAPLSARVGNSRNCGRWMLVSAVLLGVPMVVIGFVDTLGVVFALAVVEGAAAVVFDVAALTMLQRAVSESAMGRVLSVGDSLGVLGQVVGSIGAPVLVAIGGLSLGLKVSGGVLVVAVVLLAPPIIALAVRTDGERRALASVRRELGHVVELAALEPIDLERLARSVVERDVVAGTAVVEVGEPSDDLYVIRSGRFSVRVDDGRQPPDLGPREQFGEIGLLRGIPRTATVTALTDATLLVIPGKVFVAVVTPAAATEPLLSGVRTRLDRTHPHLIEAAG